VKLLDEAAVERAASGKALRLPRLPHRGRVGEVRSSSVGSSLELHDFRLYQPGDDLRQLDWNAVARTGELVLRVRQDEVSPRIEVVVDASKSMGLTPEKAARTREVALLACVLALRGGFEPVVVTVGASAQRAVGHRTREVLTRLEMDGRDGFDQALRRAPALMPCGLRLWVTDLLFEASADLTAQRLSRGASALAVVQLLDAEDVEPAGGFGARLTDSESGESLERILSDAVLADYQGRLEAHLSNWRGATRRVQATMLTASADDGIEALARSALAQLWEPE
jgi:uncharacterized protein (DUF58 family)